MKKIIINLLVVIIMSSALFAEQQTIEITVKPGDSLSKIAKKYLADPQKWPELLKFNNVKPPYRIYPGQKLLVPMKMAKKQIVEEAMKNQPVEKKEKTPAGTISYFRGDTLKNNGKIKKINEIFNGKDFFKTGNNGFIILNFTDGNNVTIYPNSKIEIKDFKKSQKTKIMLFIGKIVSKVKKLFKNQSFNIETPIALGGVRGTKFRTESGKISKIEVLEGKVFLKAGGKEVTIPAGYGSFVEEGKAPVSPVKLPPPPVITYPKQGTTIKMFKFQWKGKEKKYLVEIAKDKEFNNLIFSKEVEGNSFYPESFTISSGKYFLRVNAIKNKFTGLPSEKVNFYVR